MNRSNTLKKRITQQDVADRARVSRYTISCVVNNRTGGNVRISNETRQRVLEAIEQLGYRPNAPARSLRTRRTQLLAIMVPDLTNPFYPLLIRGSQEVAEDAGYNILVYDTKGDRSREVSFIEAAGQRWVDGLILVSFHLTRDDLTPLLDDDIPVIDIGPGINTPDIFHITSMGDEAIRQQMRYLIGKGHRRIAHLAGPKSLYPGIGRLKCYLEGLQEAGIPVDENLIRYGNFDRNGVPELVESLFPTPKRADHPTALFAANDVMAIEAMHHLIKLGWRIPEEVAVCGVDDIPEAEYVQPALTTIRQDYEEIGRQATQIILSSLNGEIPIQPRTIYIPCELIIRQST